MSTNNAVETVLNGAPAGELIEASVSGMTLYDLHVYLCFLLNSIMAS